MRAKKMVSTLLMGAIVITSFVGCTSGQQKGESEAANSKQESSSDQEAKESIKKITIGIQQSLNVENYDTNYLTKITEEAMGVDLEFMVLPADGNDAMTKFSMMVSSGSQLPDILVLGLNDTVAYDYASKGVFVETTPYLTDETKMPNFADIPESEKEVMLSTAKLADGKVYCMPRYNPFEWNEGLYRFWVYTPWLEQLGLDMPRTTDEFYEVCKAFAENDLNGNGKKDEIAVIGSKDGWGQKPFVYLMNAFTYTNPDKNYFAVEDGKIVPAFTKDEWRQGLEYMNKLVSEGLMSPLTFTQDQTQMKAILASNEKGAVGFIPSGSYSTFSASPVTHRKVDLMPPLEGPNGQVNAAQNPSGSNKFWYITKDCKDIDLAVKLSDFYYEQDMSYTIRFGEKGVEWTQDPEICEQYIGENEETMGIKTGMAVMNNIWNVPQNKMWSDMNPGYRSLESSMYVGFYKKGEIPEDANPSFIAPFTEYYVPAFPEEVIYTLPYTPEETEKISNAKTAIDTYVYDTAVAFINGTKPLSDWDKYLAELEKMGLSEYVSATQAAYDRTK